MCNARHINCTLHGALHRGIEVRRLQIEDLFVRRTHAALMESTRHGTCIFAWDRRAGEGQGKGAPDASRRPAKTTITGLGTGSEVASMALEYTRRGALG